ncbi:hypothetical protein D7X32_41645 [Corallococcus carmarthensis]|uniref:Uncharacterized protein n=1 Tax=Corallococcus carmarthensis TaxID=2316728 RepID=A0A3A8JS97_9BACT|nr:hypothetical protein D7X32_41645 [Corallococcus carmarthensis]
MFHSVAAALGQLDAYATRARAIIWQIANMARRGNGAVSRLTLVLLFVFRKLRFLPGAFVLTHGGSFAR